MKTAVARLYSRLVTVFWAVVICLLPITSLPVLSKRLGGVEVAPPSAVLLILVILFWFIPYFLRGGSLPWEVTPFILFIIVVFISWLQTFFLDIPTFKSTPVLANGWTDLLTLGIAVAFYFISSAWHNSIDRFKLTIRLLNFTGIVLLLWCAIQGYYVYFHGSVYPAIVIKIQQLVSIRYLVTGRISGFTFEPSWLAHQVNTIYIPLWLGSTLSQVSAHRFRLGGVTLENILLAGGIVIVLPSSRVGTLALFMVAAYILLRLNIRLSRRIPEWLDRFSFGKRIKRVTSSPLWSVAFLLVSFGVLAVFAIGLVYLLSLLDWRLARLFETSLIATLWKNPYQFFNYLAFAERFVFWVTGWNIFTHHPLLGVGLGNAGYFFARQMPGYGWSLPEIMELLYRTTTLPNIKSFWIRLLAETGALGFLSFLVSYFVLWRSSHLVEKSSEPYLRAIGWAGQCALVAFLAEGFSVDTFGLPYIWILMGMIGGAAALYRQTAKKSVPAV